MSAFLASAREDGVSIPPWCEVLLLDPGVDERKHLEDSLLEFPTLAKVIAANPQRDFGGCRKKVAFWQNKARLLVMEASAAQPAVSRALADTGGQVESVGKAAGKLGVAGEMLKTVLDNAKFFYEMLPHHPGFQFLPGTCLSDFIGTHGRVEGDSRGLLQCMCQSRGV